MRSVVRLQNGRGTPVIVVVVGLVAAGISTPRKTHRHSHPETCPRQMYFRPSCLVPSGYVRLPLDSKPTPEFVPVRQRALMSSMHALNLRTSIDTDTIPRQDLGQTRRKRSSLTRDSLSVLRGLINFTTPSEDKEVLVPYVCTSSCGRCHRPACLGLRRVGTATSTVQWRGGDPRAGSSTSLSGSLHGCSVAWEKDGSGR